MGRSRWRGPPRSPRCACWASASRKWDASSQASPLGWSRRWLRIRRRSRRAFTRSPRPSRRCAGSVPIWRNGRAPSEGELARLVKPAAGCIVAFALPSPWGGERFELHDIRPLTYITGPLGSGKTRLARLLVEKLPGAGLPRHGAAERRRRGPAGAARCRRGSALARGCSACLALRGGRRDLGCADRLDRRARSRRAVSARRRPRRAMPRPRRPRSRHRLSAPPRARRTPTLPDDALDRDPRPRGDRENETVILCPANHSPPFRVAPYPGAPGYEAVATCLAPPEVRARSEGTLTWRPKGPWWLAPTPVWDGSQSAARAAAEGS